MVRTQRADRRGLNRLCPSPQERAIVSPCKRRSPQAELKLLVGDIILRGGVAPRVRPAGVGGGSGIISRTRNEVKENSPLYGREGDN